MKIKNMVFLFSCSALLLFFLVGCGEKEVEQPNIITAYVVAEPVAEEPEPVVEEEPEEIETIRLCYDSDNGWVRWEAGKVFGYDNKAQRFELADECLGNNHVKEYYCDDDQIPGNISFFCRNGCVDNHCL